MASRKRPISDIDTSPDPKDIDQRTTHKQPRVDVSSLSPSRHASSSLSYPSLSQPASRAVPFQRPHSLISFSYNTDRKLEFSDAAMRYYVDPPRDANLGHGYERWIRRPEEKGRLDGLLQAISEIRRRDGDPAINVVSWRGVITKILTAPYEDRDGWELNVMVINGTLYFEEFISDARLKEKDDMTPHHRMQTYYGYAFESWCTASQPGARSGWGGDVDTNVQWCSVVKTKLGDTRIVIGGEVDCVKDKYNGRNDTMLELKTSMTIRGQRDEARFEKKLLKFYFQSFLLGVPEIVVGFRTPNGQVVTVQSYKTLEIPRMVRGKQNAWDPQICLSWGETFLAWIKSNVVEAGNGDSPSSSSPPPPPGSVWRVKFTPRVGAQFALLQEEERREVEAGEDRVGFLPKWYWREVMQDVTGSYDDSSASGVRPEPSRSPASAPTPSASAPTALPPGWQI